MSSLNVKKLKQMQIKRVLAHCDTDLRLKDEHSNKHINKELTHKNVQIGGNYKAVCNLFDDILEELDSRPKANKRIDRVVAYAIEGPLPEPDESKDTEIQRDAWIAGIENIIKEDYPEAILLAKYVHYDEVHEYINTETKEHVFSRPHLHAFVIPVIDKKLNGKKYFPGKSSLRQFHSKVDELTKEIYGFSYGNGSKKKSFDSVEHLKIVSEKAELEEKRLQILEMERQISIRNAELRRQERIVEEREQQVNRKEAKLMAFFESNVGKKAIQEYEDAMKKSDTNPLPVWRGKRVGKTNPARVNDGIMEL